MGGWAGKGAQLLVWKAQRERYFYHWWVSLPTEEWLEGGWKIKFGCKLHLGWREGMEKKKAVFKIKLLYKIKLMH